MPTTIGDLQRAYAICTGTFLEVLGLIGFVSHPVANLIGVNYLLGHRVASPSAQAGRVRVTDHD